MKSANLNFMEPSGPLRASNGTALPFYSSKNTVLSVAETRESVSFMKMCLYRTVVIILNTYTLCRQTELLNVRAGVSLNHHCALNIIILHNTWLYTELFEHPVKKFCASVKLKVYKHFHRSQFYLCFSRIHFNNFVLSTQKTSLWSPSLMFSNKVCCVPCVLIFSPISLNNTFV